ncbi:MAG TPA: UDP-3-O-(3-hydroxymyristoyl)glucosamine N-acyltransferase [Terriglobales bacterium]|nr:UDP-3-O-(3-hydroxymyristoyl)glucosamine N-acyltransferase [Terriglobales bacterium]
MKLSKISEALGTKLENASPETEITSVAGIESAAPGQLTFVSNPKYNNAAKTTQASAVIVSENFPALSTGMLRTKNPYLAWAKAVELFYHPPHYAPGVHSTAVIHHTAKVGKHAHIGAYVVIDEDAVIGDNAVLLAHVVIYRGATIGNNFFAHAHAVVREFCQLGDNVLLQNGAIVGSDGFGFAKDDEAHWHKIVQSGNVVVDSDVEIQANACIDRASIGETHIGRGSKLDNMVHVGHSCVIGQDSLLCAQVGLAGTTDVGNHVVLAGQVGSSGHLKIGDGAIAIPQSGIAQDVAPGAMVSGTPSIDHRLWLRCCAAYKRLPELVEVLRARSGD